MQKILHLVINVLHSATAWRKIIEEYELKSNADIKNKDLKIKKIKNKDKNKSLETIKNIRSVYLTLSGNLTNFES